MGPTSLQPSSGTATKYSAHLRALLFSEDLVRQLLDEEDSSLVWTVLGEKNISGNSPGESGQILAISGVGALESGAAGLEVTSRTSLH